jgi:hypothetical protein
MHDSKDKLSITNIILACLAIYIGYVLISEMIKRTNGKLEKLVNIDHSRDDEISTRVYDFLMASKGTYGDYHNYLKSIDNPNPNLSDMDTYYKLKALQTINKLTKTIILNVMYGNNTSELPKVTQQPKPQNLFPF